LLSLARQFEKQPKNAKKEGLNVLHSRCPAGQKFEKALQARLNKPNFHNTLFMPDPPKAGRCFFLAPPGAHENKLQNQSLATRVWQFIDCGESLREGGAFPSRL
jgi:hypothetical protein